MPADGSIATIQLFINGNKVQEFDADQAIAARAALLKAHDDNPKATVYLRWPVTVGDLFPSSAKVA